MNTSAEAYDPLLETQEERDRLTAELERNLPGLIGAIGVRAFHAICRQLADVVNRTPRGQPVIIEKNTADGAYLFVASHTFEQVAAVRQVMGAAALSEADIATVAKEVKERRKERN
jgi:hypothetical protein